MVTMVGMSVTESDETAVLVVTFTDASEPVFVKVCAVTDTGADGKVRVMVCGLIVRGLPLLLIEGTACHMTSSNMPVCF